jgi:hypothetical protein
MTLVSESAVPQPEQPHSLWTLPNGKDIRSHPAFWSISLTLLQQSRVCLGREMNSITLVSRYIGRVESQRMKPTR